MWKQELKETENKNNEKVWKLYCVEYNTFVFNGSIYKQMDVLATGSAFYQDMVKSWYLPVKMLVKIW